MQLLGPPTDGPPTHPPSLPACCSLGACRCCRSCFLQLLVPMIVLTTALSPYGELGQSLALAGLAALTSSDHPRRRVPWLRVSFPGFPSPGCAHPERDRVHIFIFFCVCMLPLLQRVGRCGGGRRTAGRSRAAGATMSGGGEQKSLEQTPTWAVFAVCTVFVVASLVVERLIKYLGIYLRKTKQKPLLHVLEQIKDELMLLGFISLSLTVFQAKIAGMCMPERLNKFMLPCKYHAEEVAAGDAAAAAPTTTCPAGKVQVISTEGLHQLHIFIFVMAIVHVAYSTLTVLVGLYTVHRWNKWEIQSHSEFLKCYNKALAPKQHPVGEFLNDRMKYKFLQTTRTGFHLDSYVYSFFRQFGKPIYKSDYLCLRLGFIQHHDLKLDFDFHGYIKRSMEKDFKHVVGISSYLWAFLCIYLLVDIYGWYTYFWLAFIPMIMVLFVGAKLQLIITSLAYDLRIEAKRDAQDIKVCQIGEELHRFPSIKPRNELFWFSKPGLLIFLVHFILFQNAFELAFFFWTVFTYGYSSCLVGPTWMVIVRILVGFTVQILCSACTLPLYALVSQLGTHMKDTVFKSESTGVALKNWASAAKSRHKEPNHVHQTLSEHERVHGRPKLAGIIGLTKTLDEHGHAVDAHHHNGHAGAHHHETGHHADGTHDGSHVLEIAEQLGATSRESMEKAHEDK